MPANDFSPRRSTSDVALCNIGITERQGFLVRVIAPDRPENTQQGAANDAGTPWPLKMRALTWLYLACTNGVCPQGLVCENEVCVVNALNQRKPEHFVKHDRLNTLRLRQRALPCPPDVHK